MQLKLLCFVLLLVALSVDSVDYSKAQLKQLFNKVRSCVSPDSDLIERVLYNRNVTKDEKTLHYFECASEKMGWLDEDRKFQPQLLSDFFAQNFDRTTIERVVNSCWENPTGESLGEQLFNFHQCFFTKFQIEQKVNY